MIFPSIADLTSPIDCSLLLTHRPVPCSGTRPATDGRGALVPGGSEGAHPDHALAHRVSAAPPRLLTRSASSSRTRSSARPR